MFGPLKNLVLVSVLLSVEPALGALYDGMSWLPEGKQYDYIIVGCEFFLPFQSSFDLRETERHLVAGTAGGVLARRLSENPNRNVLVIEAGGIK
jgi:hypothetical protein